MDSLHHTEYAEYCTEVIEQNAEYPSDQMLIQLVRLQNITEEISQALPHDNFESPHWTQMSSAPIALCIKTLEKKLNMFRARIPAHLQQNRKPMLTLALSFHV